MWRVQAVTEEGTAFTNRSFSTLTLTLTLTQIGTVFPTRLGLLEAWRGVRDDELSSLAGIEG